MELRIPELTEIPVPLHLELRTTRRRTGPSLGPIPGAVSLGIPVVRPADSDLVGEDATLRAFLAEQNSQWRFHLIFLGCSFLPGDAKIQRAWLTVSLTRDDGRPAPAPIAWSCTPLREEKPADRPPNKITLTAGMIIKASAEFTTSSAPDEVSIEAYGLQEPACTWQFNRTSRADLTGSRRLVLVTRIPHGTHVTGAVELRATLTRKRLGLLTHTSKLDDNLPLTFSLA